MAINKKLIHFNTFENFNSKKLSANKENTQYTLGVNGSIMTGEPEILYQSIVYIKDTLLQWTHGLLYDCSEPVFIQGDGKGSAVLKNSTTCSATGENSIAGGNLAAATGDNSISIGRGCSAIGNYSSAFGGLIQGIRLTGPANSLIYKTNIPIDILTYFVGETLYFVDDTYNTVAATIQSVKGNYITVDTTLSADLDLNNALFIYRGALAVGDGSVAINGSHKAIGLRSFASGYLTIAAGAGSHAEGYRTLAEKNYAHSEGFCTKAGGLYTHAEGYCAEAIGISSHAEGGVLSNVYFTGSNKIYTITKGINANNSFSFIKSMIGKSVYDYTSSTKVATIVSTDIALDGYTVTVSLDSDLGILSDAQFGIAVAAALGESSHSENASSAHGHSSHSGGNALANGYASFAHGFDSTADGEVSTVFGLNNYVQNSCEVALGRSNQSHTGDSLDKQTLLSIGCGKYVQMDMVKRINNKIPLSTPEDGTNALEIMQNGDIWLGNYTDGHKIWDNVNKRVCNSWSMLGC